MKSLIICLLLTASCVHTSNLKYPKLCSTPQLVLVTADVDPAVIKSNKYAINVWNKIIGREIFIFAGKVDFTSRNTPQNINYIVINIEEPEEPQDLAITRFSFSDESVSKCTKGAIISIRNITSQIDRVMVHELGHVLGLGHSHFGLMKAKISRDDGFYLNADDRIEVQERYRN